MKIRSESASLLRALIDETKDGIVVLAADGTIQDANDRALAIVGSARSEVLGAPMQSFFPPSARPAANRALGAALRGEEILQSTRLRNPSGQAAEVEVRARPVGGQVLVIMRDVSELRRHLRALRIVSSALSAASDKGLFPDLATALVRALPVDYAFVGELLPSADRVQLRGFATPDGPADLLQYHLAATPCEVAIQSLQPVFTRHLSRDFPEDEMLVDLGVETYQALPLLDSGGSCVGILGILNHASVPEDELVTATLELVAGRAAAEVANQRSDRARRAMEGQLRNLLGSTSQMAAHVGRARAPADNADSSRGLPAMYSPGAAQDSETDEDLGALLDSIPVPVSMTRSASGKFIAVNNAFLETTGFSTVDVRDRTPEELGLWIGPEEHRPSRRALTSGGWSGESQIRTIDGETRRVLVSFRAVEWHGKSCVLGAYVDITHRRTAEALAEERQRKIRKLLRLLLRAQEGERERISRELHDEIGQSMTAVQLTHASLLESGVDETEKRSRIYEAMRIVDRVMDQLRSLAFDLRPTMIEELGLRGALDSLASRIADRAGWRIETELTEVEAPQPVALASFRIAQEALNNVVKHAQAGRVRLRLFVDTGVLGLQVEDDGVGISTGSDTSPHLGLEIMRERAESLGGQLRIESRGGGGTVIDARIPLRESA